ncbi:MAG: complex I subunit 1 family protein [Thermofilum sp.]
MMEVLYSLVFPGVLFTAAMAFWFEYIDRKVTALVQRRVGPQATGPGGLLQPLYDFLKLLGKEELVSEKADKVALRVGPVLAVTLPIYGMLYIPIVSTDPPLGFSGDLLLIFLLLAFSALSVALVGYAALSPYTVLGVGRFIAQYAMYEAVFMLCLVSAALQASTLSVSGLVTYQAARGWLALYQPIGFVAALLSLLAKLEKKPFDLPHAKQEIVAGWATELSGRSLAFMRLYEDLSMTWGIALLATVYLGGPLGPGFPELGPLAGFAWFGLKTFTLSVLVALISASMARVRVYGLVKTFWERTLLLVLLQIGLAWLLR